MEVLEHVSVSALLLRDSEALLVGVGYILQDGTSAVVDEVGVVVGDLVDLGVGVGSGVDGVVLVVNVSLVLSGVVSDVGGLASHFKYSKYLIL